MYISRDGNGTLHFYVNKPSWDCDHNHFAYDDEMIEIPTEMFWTDVLPGECRELVLGVHTIKAVGGRSNAK